LTTRSDESRLAAPEVSVVVLCEVQMTIADATEALGNPATIAGYTNPVQPTHFFFVSQKSSDIGRICRPGQIARRDACPPDLAAAKKREKIVP
jgi:hypothetical protein